MTADGIGVRIGGAGDVTRVLSLYDQAVTWLADQGLAGRWGTKPWSAIPGFVARLNDVAADGDLRVAETNGQLVGALWLTRAPQYIPPAAEPEVYLEGFVMDRHHAGIGTGQALLDAARAEAAERGARQLRLDCWAGGDQSLVRYYERAGFTPAGRFTLEHILGGWHGIILTHPL